MQMSPPLNYYIGSHVCWCSRFQNSISWDNFASTIITYSLCRFHFKAGHVYIFHKDKKNHLFIFKWQWQWWDSSLLILNLRNYDSEIKWTHKMFETGWFCEKLKYGNFKTKSKRIFRSKRHCLMMKLYSKETDFV